MFEYQNIRKIINLLLFELSNINNINKYLNLVIVFVSFSKRLIKCPFLLYIKNSAPCPFLFHFMS